MKKPAEFPVDKYALYDYVYLKDYYYGRIMELPETYTGYIVEVGIERRVHVEEIDIERKLEPNEIERFKHNLKFELELLYIKNSM